MTDARDAPASGTSRSLVILAVADALALGFVLVVLIATHLATAARVLLAVVAVLLALAAVLSVLAARSRGVDRDVVTALAPSAASDRAAVRGAQRIARQLHQLLAASIAVAGLRSETEVLARLAGSVRNVFDADDAIVTLDDGTAAPLCVVAARGQETAWGPTDPEGAAHVPTELRHAVAPQRQGEWLVVPLLVRRGVARGIVAVRRANPAAFSDDDVEVLTLLAQMATSAVDASEMNRTILSSEERWRVLVEAAPVGIVETDLEGRVQWWNKAAGALFSWPRFDGRADGSPVGFPDDALPTLHELWAEVVSGSSVVGRDLSGVGLAGRRRDLTASAALLAAAEGGATSILTLVDDVTDHLQLMEELRHAQRMEVIGQLSSSVAHDFNNLLTLITGYAELLDHEVGDDERAGQLVQDIQATTTRASTLTGKLLTMGRTKSPTPTVFSPSQVVQSIAEVLDRVIGSNIALTLSLDAAAGNVRADADQFEQTILNLATNARDAMPAGGALSIAIGAVTLGADEAVVLDVPAGPYVRISVADTGDGMDEETQQRCFEPLFTTKGPSKGTGLGLPAARRVVTESGGAIRCTSEVGVGTTFELVFPVVFEPVATPASAEPAPRQMDAATVLLAEDEDGIRRMVSRVLEHSGYTVLEADSGEQALEVAASFGGEIDLLVSDVVMPGMTGRDLAGQLQAARPRLLVVLVSGNVEAAVMEGLVEGSASFLAKPFRPSELVDVVRELRERRTALAASDRDR